MVLAVAIVIPDPLIHLFCPKLHGNQFTVQHQATCLPQEVTMTSPPTVDLRPPLLSTPPPWLLLLLLLLLSTPVQGRVRRAGTTIRSPPTRSSSRTEPVGRGLNQSPKLGLLFLSDSHPQLYQMDHFHQLPLEDFHSERGNQSPLETPTMQTTSDQTRDRAVPLTAETKLADWDRQPQVTRNKICNPSSVLVLRPEPGPGPDQELVLLESHASRLPGLKFLEVKKEEVGDPWWVTMLGSEDLLGTRDQSHSHRVLVNSSHPDLHHHRLGSDLTKSLLVMV